jgi:hypothetical protein
MVNCSSATILLFITIFNVTSLIGVVFVNLLSISSIVNLKSLLTKSFIDFTVCIMSETYKKTHFPLTISLILKGTAVDFSRSSSMIFL